MTPRRVAGALQLLLRGALSLPLAAFHGFVGWHKTFSTHEELVRHSAWTMHLPMWLGRVVGLFEMALSAALLVALLRQGLARLGTAACIAFIALEAIAASLHYLTGDGGSLVQNAVSIVLTALLAWLYALRARG